MKKKVKIKYAIIIIVILSIVLVGFLIWKINNTKSQNKDPRECVERKLDIELGEGIVLVEGEAYDDEYGEERVDAKFSVSEQELEKLKVDLEENLNPYGLEEIGKISDFNDIWSDLKRKKY